MARRVESSPPNHGCVISQSYREGGSGVGSAVGAGEAGAVGVVAPPPCLSWVLASRGGTRPLWFSK